MLIARPMRSNARRFLIATFIIAGSLSQLQAQPVLDLRRVISNWPTIELYFTTKCLDLPVNFTDKSYLKVYEDGKPQSFTLWCPDPTARCFSSTVLLFDMSASMIGLGVTNAMVAGMNFVGLIDTLVDEASVISFSRRTSVLQSLTTERAALRSAVSSLTATSSPRFLWDAIYSGVSQAMNGSNPCRSVIVISSGGDEGSASTLTDVLGLAVRNRIRIHTIAHRAAGDTASLAAVAKQTGGQFHTAWNDLDMSGILRDLYMSNVIVFTDECYITYQAASPDGSLRKVELRVENFCNGAATDTGSYQAPLLTSTDGSRPVLSNWSLAVFPHPTTSTATISFRGDTRECVHVMVMDASGRLVQDFGERLNVSSSVLSLSMADRPAGVYYILGVTASDAKLCRLIKQ